MFSLHQNTPYREIHKFGHPPVARQQMVLERALLCAGFVVRKPHESYGMCVWSSFCENLIQSDLGNDVTQPNLVVGEKRCEPNF